MKHEACTAEINLRVPPSLRNRVEVAAAADRRNPSQFLRNLIEDALDDRRGGAAAQEARA